MRRKRFLVVETKYLLLFGLQIVVLMGLLQQCTHSEATNDKVDSKNGYKSIQLNNTLDSVKKQGNFRLTYDNKCTSTQKYKTSDLRYLTIGSIDFDTIVLEFTLNRLNRITLIRNSSGSELMSELLTIYKAEFGEPSTTSKRDVGTVTQETADWKGRKSSINIVDTRPGPGLYVDYTSIEGYKRLFNEEEKCKQRRIEEGQSDL